MVLEFPVLAGKRDQLRSFARKLEGEKRLEFEASQRGFGISKEGWFLREDADGDTVVVYVEAEDVAKALGALVQSKEPVDLWLKQEVAEITGIDFNNPPRATPFQPILLYRY